MLKTISLLSFILILNIHSSAGNSEKIFNKQDIEKLSGVYLESVPGIKNPVMVDVDKDGDFDILKFDDGNVEYYRNTGTLDAPVFILENRNYDTYERVMMIDPKIPYPLFFADSDSDGDMDMFVVKDRVYNKDQNMYSYKTSYSENVLGLDTGTLVTIILILVIVILVLAILR